MRSDLIVAALAGLLVTGCSTAPKATDKVADTKPKLPAKAPDVYRVKLATTKGDIVVEVYREWAPNGASHFYDLAGMGYYDNVRFHRVLKKFIAQFGINGNPKLDQIYAALKIPDDPPKQKNRRGTLAFAKIGPGSRTTEVFINLSDNPALDQTGFVPFGKIVEGLEVADQISYLYGEIQPKGGGPDPAKIHQQGNSYLEQQYPRLDWIKTATVELVKEKATP